MEQTKTINLDGVAYDVAQFSPGVQQAILIYNKFTGQLQDQQLEVMKTQAAIQQVGSQITEAVQKELEAKRTGVEGDVQDVDVHVPNGSDGVPHEVQ